MKPVTLPLIAAMFCIHLPSFAQTDDEFEKVEQTLEQLQEETVMRVNARLQAEAKAREEAKIAAKQLALKNKTVEPVIIIGAGLSGLAAAHYLDNHSHPKFLVLEADKYIGGRVKTKRLRAKGWQGETLNIGASTIYGYSQGNPLTSLTQQATMQGYSVDEESQVLYDYNGKRVSLGHDQRDDHRFNHFLNALSTMTGPSYQQRSIGDALFNYLSQRKLSDSETRGLMYRASNMIELHYGQDLRLLSLPNLNSADDFPGADWRATNGFDQLPAYLATSLNDRIKTNVAIKTIDYRKPNEIALTSTAGNTYYAKKVIITLPVSVIKQHITFKPSLPKAKKIALDHIKMGTVNKLWLKFPRVFWDKNVESIHFQANAKVDKQGFINKGKTPSFVNAYKHTGEPILIAVTSGDYASHLETLDDKAITAQLMRTLRTIYGANIPQPIAHYYTRWHQAPLSLGSVSSLTVGAKPGNIDYQQLATPIDKRLLFAGDATSARFPGTAHGAYLSGIREARRLLEAKPGLSEQKIASYLSNIKPFTHTTKKRKEGNG